MASETFPFRKTLFDHFAASLLDLGLHHLHILVLGKMLVAGEPAEGQRVGLFVVVWAHVFVDAFRIVIGGPVYELEIELLSPINLSSRRAIRPTSKLAKIAEKLIAREFYLGKFVIECREISEPSMAV